MAQIIEILLILIGFGAMFYELRTGIKSHALRLDALEAKIDEIYDMLFTDEWHMEDGVPTLRNKLPRNGSARASDKN